MASRESRMHSTDRRFWANARQSLSRLAGGRPWTVRLIVAVALALAVGLPVRTLWRVNQYMESARGQNIVARHEALMALGRMGSRRAVPLLEATAADRTLDVSLRRAAVTALGDIGASGSVEALAGLLDDPDPGLVEAAVEALGRMGDGRAVGPLVRLVREKRARLTALWSLGAIGDPRAVPLLNLELSDPDIYVAYNARQSLKRLAAGQ